ncbi:MAG: hypothetical protein HY819_13500 [Acidobacteria bacterium]|nr:hypothetical protein [Acidobacteriota bacterium]
MKKRTLQIALVTLLALGLSFTQSLAQEPTVVIKGKASQSFVQENKQAIVKGQWAFQTQANGKILTIHTFFKKNNKGFVVGGSEGTLPLIYNQKGNNLTATFQTPWLFDYPNVTILFNGTLSDDNNISGTATIITSQEDLSSPNGFFTFTTSVIGQRESFFSKN